MELAFIAAHMMGDFVLQTPWMAVNKPTDWKARTLHVALYTLGFAAVMLLWSVALRTSLLFLMAVFVTHWLTDSRRWADGTEWPPRPIMVDQAIHLVTLAVLYRLFFV